MVVTVKALLEELVALSLGYEIEIYKVCALSPEVLKIVCNIVFVFHQPL